MSFFFEIVLSGAIVYFIYMIHQYWFRAAKYDCTILDFKQFLLDKGLKERGFESTKPTKKSDIDKAEKFVDNDLDYADALLDETKKLKNKKKK